MSGKGVIPYEKVNSIDSLNPKPEGGTFFTVLFSTLKGKAVDDEDYLNSKKTLYAFENERFFQS